MKTEIRYFTRTGNTEKLAVAIAESVGVKAEPIDIPLTEHTDVLFLGASYYAFDMDPLVKHFLSENADKIGTVVVFGTSAMMKSMIKPLRKVARQYGFTAFERDFHCPGHWKFANKDRPNREDLASAAEFAKSVLESYNESTPFS